MVWIGDDASEIELSDLRGWSVLNFTPFFGVVPTISDGLTEAHMLRIRAFLHLHRGHDCGTPAR